MLKASFAALFGPEHWCRNLVLMLFTFVAKWAADYWHAAPEVTRHAAIACLVFYLLDTFTGAMVALKNGCFSSAAFRGGVWKFVAYASSTLTAVGLDYLFVGHLLGDSYTVVMIILTIIAVNEASSIIENSGKLGFPWPQRIMDMMAQLRKVCEEDGSETHEDGA